MGKERKGTGYHFTAIAFAWPGILVCSCNVCSTGIYGFARTSRECDTTLYGVNKTFPSLDCWTCHIASNRTSIIHCVCTRHTECYTCTKHNFGVVDGSPNSDQDPMHERNSGTFLVMYVGNGIDGLGKKENSILLSYHVLFPTSDSCEPSECILYLHIWVMKQREHETGPLIRPFLKPKHWPVLIMYLDIVPVWFILKQREHDAIVMVLSLYCS